MRNQRITFACLVCGREFKVKRNEVAKGRGKYCSRDCRWSVPTDEASRFWPKVDKNGPIPEHCPELGRCWLWLGALSEKGYGFFKLADGRQGKAHQWAYLNLVGPNPNKLLVLHRCDNPPCVNPAHLFLGTQKVNIRDMMTKGRDPDRRPGEASNFAKLTAEDVIEIRRRYAEGGMYQWQLAEQFGITQRGVSLIIRRERWRHVP